MEMMRCAVLARHEKPISEPVDSIELEAILMGLNLEYSTVETPLGTAYGIEALEVYLTTAHVTDVRLPHAWPISDVSGEGANALRRRLGTATVTRVFHLADSSSWSPTPLAR